MRLRKLTLEELQERLCYEPTTGVFTWHKDVSQAVKAGAVAGTLNPNELTIIGIDRHYYAAHHLAWLYVYGEWPKGRRLRFADGDKQNLRIENLVEPISPRDTPHGTSAMYKAWHATNPTKARSAYLKSVFGITAAQWDEMYTQQNGCCAICHRPEWATRKGKPKRLSVDHCHETNKVRGLLCESLQCSSRTRQG